MGILKMRVEDMSCGHCAAAIQTSLEAIPGVSGVEADLGARVVRVTAEESVSPQAAAEAVRTAGYTPEILE
jgi:copper chaperone